MPDKTRDSLPKESSHCPSLLHLLARRPHIGPLERTPFDRVLDRLYEVLHGQHRLIGPPLGADEPGARGEGTHEDTGYPVVAVGLPVVPVNGAQQGPDDLVDDLPVPADVLRHAHGGTQGDVAGAPDVAGARRAELVGDGDEGAGPRGREAPVLAVELRLGQPRQGEVVVPWRQGARDGVVEAAVEPPKRVGRRHHEVEPHRRGQRAQRVVVDADVGG